MKLSEHVDKLRNLIEVSFDKEFARLGIGKINKIDTEKLPEELRPKRKRYEAIIDNHIGETGGYESAREKLMDELTFTLFNRMAAVKVMEAANLFPPVLTKQPEHGDRSFGHKAWLEMQPDMRSEELEGIREYIKHAFNELGETLPLYSKSYPYALLPDTITLNEIIDSFNEVEKDTQVGSSIWESDDALGWMYESYNNAKKAMFKESKEKTEYNKVSLQSQVYTPRWVVQFLVDNSLGKLYLEMYPDSEIKNHYKIANAPATQERKPKPLHEVKLIDPACGSGNFLLYAFDFFYELYIDQIENYGANYNEEDIAKLIIENNLHGIDLDDRAVQLAQLGLFIKAKKKRRTIGEIAFNVVSSDFFLPEYSAVERIFIEGTKLDNNQRKLIADIWTDLQFAYKYGSLIRLDEKVKFKMHRLVEERDREEGQLFADKDLGIRPKPTQVNLFKAHDIEQEKNLVITFFDTLKTAVEQYARTEGNTFLTSKTRDAITFLELLTTEYDVATANPPYTDSADFGPELKEFIEGNYKKPYKFHTNLYATFIKRCYDLVGECGFVAALHPLTFMYIKTFEHVRRFILTKTNINLLAELGLGGVFANSDVQVDVCMYVIEKGNSISKGTYFDLKLYKNHTNKPEIFKVIYNNFINNHDDEHVYTISQSKLKIIKSWPFIYWISDEFRGKFGGNLLDDYVAVCSGLATCNNNMFLRFWWEVACSPELSFKINKRWFFYSKGGPYNKWFGNLWCTVNWKENGKDIHKYNDIPIDYNGAPVRNKKFYFKEGVTYSASGSKGASFRYLPKQHIFDVGGASIFLTKSFKNNSYLLALLNSKLAFYIISCLNPTVNTQVGDLRRIPFIIPSERDEKAITLLTKQNIEIKKTLSNQSLIEFHASEYVGSSSHNIKKYFNYENHLLTQVLINEAIINTKIFDVYDLTEHDKAMVLDKEGDSIGDLPVSKEARKAYLEEAEAIKEFPLDNIREFIGCLPVKEFSAEEQEAIESGFSSLYRGNNNLEEFCIRHKVNPINVWYWFKQCGVLPHQRTHTLSMEFLADIIREILMEDEDGIIPLVPNAGEKVLLDRIEEKFREKKISSAHYSSFDSVLGCPIHDYLNKDFFAELSGHLKLFKQLPATPFIWHLSSGSERGFDCYIIIYKWSRDKLMRLRSVYIEHRERALVNRQSDLTNNDRAEAQNEKERIIKQLREIESFKVKIDELLSEGYNPILDDGVGKNIAPLQKKKMIPYEVLNAGQLKKYSNADW